MFLEYRPEPVSFVAGAFSGACGVAVSQPFDMIKVRLQNTGGYDLAVLGNLLRYEGFVALWRGFAPSLIGASIGNSISFGVVENMKRKLMHNRAEPLELWEHAVCGFFSGVTTSFITAPTEGVRIKMQTQLAPEIYSGEAYCKSSWEFTAHIIRKNGLLGIYRGFLTTILRDSIGDAAFFATYQAAPRILFGGKESTEHRGVFSVILGGGIAGIAFWTTIYPIDTIKSRIQADSIVSPKYLGTMDCLLRTIKANGFWSLYQGFGTCVLRAFPVNIALVLGFEFSMNLIGRDYNYQLI